MGSNYGPTATESSSSQTSTQPKKSKIVKSETLQEQSDDSSDVEAQYELTTCIKESGGVDRFLETPCIILYKKNLRNQS